MNASMKPSRVTTLVPGLLLVLLSGACENATPDGVLNSGVLIPPGRGAIVEETRQVGTPSGVVFDGVGQLTVHQGGSGSLQIRTEEQVLPFLRTEVRGGRLWIGFEEGTSFHGQSPVIELTLTVPDLDRLELDGVGIVEVIGFSTTRLAIVHAGVGSLEISGAVTEQIVTLSGIGDYDAEHLDSTTADISILGAGSATVRVSDRLDARTSGTGSVYYYGNPAVSQSGSGTGVVRRMGE